jgi:hypothetical protein
MLLIVVAHPTNVGSINGRREGYVLYPSGLSNRYQGLRLGHVLRDQHVAEGEIDAAFAAGGRACSPRTIRAAPIAGTPWLDVFCPGCGTSRAIDLRKVDRHPLAAVATLVLGAAVLVVPGIRADAEDPRFARVPPAAKAAASNL